MLGSDFYQSVVNVRLILAVVIVVGLTIAHINIHIINANAPFVRPIDSARAAEGLPTEVTLTAEDFRNNPELADIFDVTDGNDLTFNLEGEDHSNFADNLENIHNQNLLRQENLNENLNENFNIVENLDNIQGILIPENGFRGYQLFLEFVPGRLEYYLNPDNLENIMATIDLNYLIGIYQGIEAFFSAFF